MLPEIACERIAHYAGLVLGVRADYPAPATIVPPHLVVFWDETSVSEMNEQTWMMVVKGQLMVARKGNIASEIASADSLIVPVVDTFSANAVDRSAYHLRTDDGDMVDYCRVERVQPSLGIGYAGHAYYGAELWWGIKLRRFAGS